MLRQVVDAVDSLSRLPVPKVESIVSQYALTSLFIYIYVLFLNLCTVTSTDLKKRYRTLPASP